MNRDVCECVKRYSIGDILENRLGPEGEGCVLCSWMEADKADWATVEPLREKVLIYVHCVFL